ncbi:hypothetical protein SEA_SATIS_47 [Streptomyces phage Satis]|nr:hypothetical protein SEA_SATIS_47 [Streptomyces phage Satis]QBZ71946.1 hypothetical protein SEA_KRADAL_47 [Streptomyces phage Kradal]QPL14364.1 hypothetical protein SEA_EHYELIMAYOE_47 [Streptomyces phage EhyElimayoE]
MTVKRKSKPWKVVFLTAGGPLPEKTFTSETAAYRAVNHEREQIRDGVSRVSRAVVYQWDKNMARWMTFERHDLKAEADALPPGENVEETT